MKFPTAPFQCTALDGSIVPGLRLGPVEVFAGEKGGKFPDGNQVLVRGSDSVAAFDTPLVANRIAKVLGDADLFILGHVHEDHTAGLHLFPEIPVHAPEGDILAVQSLDGLARHYGYSQGIADAMVARAESDYHFKPRPDALAYADGTVWDLGGGSVRAIHMPGHTAGHSVLLIEPHGIAFIGDIDLSGFGPYYGDATSDLASFQRTLDRVAEVPAQAWVTSHHKGVVTSRSEFLSLLRNFAGAIERRDDALLKSLHAAPATLEELVATRFVYPPSYNDVFVPDVERRVIQQHLDAFLAAGRVVLHDQRYHAA